MEDPYTKRELDSKFQGITDMFSELRTDLFDKERGYLPGIKEQTTKTNGRVTRLEQVALVLITGLVVEIATTHTSLSAMIAFFAHFIP